MTCRRCGTEDGTVLCLLYGLAAHLCPNCFVAAEAAIGKFILDQIKPTAVTQDCVAHGDTAQGFPRMTGVTLTDCVVHENKPKETQ